MTVRTCPVPREQQFRADACLALCLVSRHGRMRETQPVDLNEREKELPETAHSLLPISAARLPAPSRARFLHLSFYRGRLIRPEQTCS